MAAPQSKSSSFCSPLPSKPTNPRNSEISNPMRRSFAGNPFAKPSIIPNQRSGFNPKTPANSPSDHSRRNSIGRGSVVVTFRDHEDKENSKDQKSKLCSVRSPAPSKSSKNFMSPTISAASKFNASPRKKILTERNESVHTSVSLSDGNGPLKENSECNPVKGLNQKKEVSFNPTITYLEDKEEEVRDSYEDFDRVNHNNNKDDSDSFSEMVLENDIVILDPSFKISPRTSFSLRSPAFAPLDADPSMPPYDIKNNYTSPRPQFLHYKPKPLVELYLKQKDGKQLEESFASESSSDAEITAKEILSEESSLDSLKEYDTDVTSDDVVTEEKEEEEEEEEAELIVSEPYLVTTFEGTIEARKLNKRHFVKRPKFTALLFVLALAGLWASFSNSPIMDPSVLNNLNFPNLYVPPEISEFTRENLEGLAQKFRQWLYDSLSYIHNRVIGFREWHNSGHLKFSNLTILLEKSSADSYLLVDDHSSFAAEKGQPIEADMKVEKGPEFQQPVRNEDKEEILEADEFVEVVEEGYHNEVDECNEEVADSKSEESEYEEAIVVPEYEADESYKGVGDGKEEEAIVVPQNEADESYKGVGDGKEEEAIVVPESFEASRFVTAPESEELRMAIQTEATEHNILAIDEATEPNNLATEEEAIVVPESFEASRFVTAPESEELRMAIQTEATEHNILAIDEATEPNNLATEVTHERVSIAENISQVPINADVTEQSVALVDAAETEAEVSSLHQLSAENAIEPKMADFNPESFDSEAAAAMEQPLAGSVDILSRQAMVGILFSTVLSLIAAVTLFVYTKNRTTGALNAATTSDQVPIAEMVDHSPQERSFSKHWQEEVETIGESCPSEMSSFFYSSSYSKQERGTSEAHSQEKRRLRSNNRRESMASSDCSMGSASYGSFTTYEKVQIKLGKGEEEFLTPVRRSSRIKKQVTSP